MPAVSNTTPLILFAKTERLGILQALFGEVYVPPEVMSEIGY